MMTSLIICLFGVEKIKKFIQSRGSLKSHTQLQTKMGKIYHF